MAKEPKVEAFSKLFSLLTFYSEYRDMPVEKDFDFFQEVQNCCEILELNYEELKEEFKLV